MGLLTESVVEKIVGFAADVTKRWRCYVVSHCHCSSGEILLREKLDVTRIERIDSVLGGTLRLIHNEPETHGK